MAFQNSAQPPSGLDQCAVRRENRRRNDENEGQYEDYYFNQKIGIPTSESNERLSWSKLWAFTGPGFLMSIAYLDPGNIESDLQSGAAANYKLLWVLFLATVFGLLMQRLAARLGVVTGHHLAELCRICYPKVPRYLLWVLVEIAVVGSDMQEVIGTSIALYLITDGWLSPYWGVIITICDTFTFLLLDKYGLRKLEAFFIFLITVMAFTFGIEYVKSDVPQGEVLKGLLIPWCENCDGKALKQAVGIIGAVIMPHNLYLHSALVKSRNIDRRDKRNIAEANKYYFIESAIALSVSLIINVCVMGVFAKGLYGRTEKHINAICAASSLSYHHRDVFTKNDTQVNINIYKAGIFLGCESGVAYLIIWAVGILAAGQSSTMTGTYSGQFIMEGFLNLNISRWLRVLLTRSIAIGPTLLIAMLGSINELSQMNDLMNAVMTLQLPFALLPLLTFVCSDNIMGEFRSGKWTKLFASCVSSLVIAINIFSVYQFVRDNLPRNTLVYLLVGVFTLLYVIFLIYLVGCLFVVFGITAPMNMPIVGKYLTLNDLDQASPCLSTRNTLESAGTTVA